MTERLSWKSTQRQSRFSRTSVATYVEHVGKVPKLMTYEGLNKENLGRVIGIVDDIVAGGQDVMSSVPESVLNQTFNNIMRLSDGKVREGNVTHIMSGTVLHYATGRSDIETFAKILAEPGIDLHAQASYSLPRAKDTEPHNVVHLGAIHIAAFQGQLNKLKMIWEQAGENMDEEASNEAKDRLLCSSAEICKITDTGEDERNVHFTPLHFAILGGSENCDEMIQWLLEHNADPTKVDHSNTTPLHLLSYLGFPPELFLENARVEEIVKMMIEKGSTPVEDEEGKATGSSILLQKSHSPAFAKAGTGRHATVGSTPLQLATHPGSQFPTQKIHLLSEAFAFATLVDDKVNTHDRNAPDFFTEILTVVSSTRQGAIHFAMAAEEASKCGQLWLDGLRPTSISALAILMFRCPEAARMVFEVLSNDMCEPDVMDIYTHPLPTLVDFQEKSLVGRFVSWEFRTAYNGDTLLDYYQPLDTKKCLTIPWPQWKSDEDQSKEWHAVFAPTPGPKAVPKDCKIKVSIMPNLIHLDMFWALANVPDDQIHVMGEETIQALVTCVWSHAVWRVHIVDLLTTLCTVAVLWYWGVFAREIGKETMPQMQHSILWCCLLGLVIRDVLETLEWILQYHRRRVKAQQQYGDHSDFAIGVQMWDFDNFFRLTPITQDLINLSGRLALLLFSSLYPSPEAWTEASFVPASMGSVKTWRDFAIVLLSLNIGFAFVKALRLSQMVGGIGLNIVAVLSSLLSGRMPQMLMVSSLVLFMFVAIFNVLIRNQTTYYMFIYLYRGLIFGDGDGLDFMGMKTDYSDADSDMPEKHEQPFHALTKGVFMTFATVLFNIVILNLVIAVYGNEYESMVEKSEGMFTRMRSMYCAKYLMLSGESTVSTMIAEKLHLLTCGYSLGFLLIVGSLAWLKYSDQVSYIASFLMAVGFLLWRERAMAPHNDWFDTSAEEEKKPFYLWWCCPHDFEQDRFKGEDQKKDEETDMLEGIADKVQDLIESASGKSDFEKLGKTVDHLDTQMAKVLKAVENLRRSNISPRRPSTLD